VSYKFCLPDGTVFYRSHPNRMRVLFQQNGIIISKLCSSCKQKLPIEQFSRSKDNKDICFAGPCKQCLRQRWITKYNDNHKKKLWKLGVKPRTDYLSLRIKRVNGVEVLKCNACRRQLPLCDYPQKTDGSVRHATCIQCRITSLRAWENRKKEGR
jgi:hypothetical protein